MGPNSNFQAPATHAYTSPYFINEGKVIKEEERRNKVKSFSALLAHHVKKKDYIAHVIKVIPANKARTNHVTPFSAATNA